MRSIWTWCEYEYFLYSKNNTKNRTCLSFSPLKTFEFHLCPGNHSPVISLQSHVSLFSCPVLLILASLRMRNFFEDDSSDSNHKEKRGPTPTTIEWCIYIYVLSFIWNEIKQLWSSGVVDYLNDWWNLLDFATNTLYITTIVLKVSICYIKIKKKQREKKKNYEIYK